MSEEVGYEHIRVRLVFPKELTLTNAANSPLVEVYEMKKDQVKKASLSISQLSKTAALALENELFYLITKNAGVNIPMM
jgi:hypothetical protein